MVNMWCAHTLMLTKPMQTVAPTITGYPKMGFRENTGMISDANAKAGIISTYTSGCPKSQKRHAAELHPGASHAKNRCDDINRRTDAPESGNHQRNRPVVRAVTRRKS